MCAFGQRNFVVGLYTFTYIDVYSFHYRGEYINAMLNVYITVAFELSCMISSKRMNASAAVVQNDEREKERRLKK